MADNPQCRLCGLNATQALGALPESDYFAGRVLRDSLPGGALWRCAACHSLFRYPVLSDAEYLALYENGEADQWGGTTGRQDRIVVRRALSRGRLDRILDIGCGSGEFLTTFPADVEKHGIEPSSLASSLARERGIKIVADSWDKLGDAYLYDAICVVDVVEHIPDVVVLLNRLYAQLKPGGVLILSTGDPEIWIWRKLFRARFWYAAFPEHVTFPSFRFLQQWSRQAAGATVTRERTVYRSLSALGRATGWVIQLAFWVSPACFNVVGATVARKWREPSAVPRRYFAPGVPGAFKDHQVVTIQKSFAGSG